MSAAVKYRVDYSELVDLLNNGFERKAGKLFQEVRPRLVEYLRVTMAADLDSAQECVQQAIVGVYERIIRGKIKEPQSLFSYLMRAARNEYINYCRLNQRYKFSDYDFEEQAEPASQLDSLIEEDRMAILEECLEELESESKEFITFFIDNPDVTTRDASIYFGMSQANVRTKKSRLTHVLNSMYRMKSYDVMA